MTTALERRHGDDEPLSEAERAFAARAIRRKRVFQILSNASIAVAVGLAVLYGWMRARNPEFDIAPRAVLIVLILLNARQNLRQYKYAAILEKLLRS